MSLLKDVIGYGLHADRPAASSEGRLYYETDTNTIFRDNGTSWDTLTLSGGGGTGGLSDAEITLGTSVTLTSSLADILTLSLTAGTWYLFGPLECYCTTGTGAVEWQLNDGASAVYGQNGIGGLGTAQAFCEPIFGRAVLTATTTVHLQARNVTGSNDIEASDGVVGGTLGTRLFAINIA